MPGVHINVDRGDNEPLNMLNLEFCQHHWGASQIGATRADLKMTSVALAYSAGREQLWMTWGLGVFRTKAAWAGSGRSETDTAFGGYIGIGLMSLFEIRRYFVGKGAGGAHLSGTAVVARYSHTF